MVCVVRTAGEREGERAIRVEWVRHHIVSARIDEVLTGDELCQFLGSIGAGLAVREVSWWNPGRIIKGVVQQCVAVPAIREGQLRSYRTARNARTVHRRWETCAIEAPAVAP